MNKKHISITEGKKICDNSSPLENLFNLLLKELSDESLNTEQALSYAQRFKIALHKALEKETSSGSGNAFAGLELIRTKEENQPSTFHIERESVPSKKMMRLEYFKKIICLLIAISLITLGFSMIILPAPPYFEMFTIFYFTDDDGVTIMDLISLIIILCGIYVFVTTIIKKPTADGL